MFSFADKNKDGKISYTEFQAMINPPNPPKPPTEAQPQMVGAVKRVTINTTAMVESTDTIESNIDDNPEEESLICTADLLSYN